MLTEQNGKTYLTIEINLPKAIVETMVAPVADKLGFNKQPANITPVTDEVEFICQATKQWYFDKAKAALLENAEALAQQEFDAVKAVELAKMQAFIGA
jgi:hypothetical protein